MTAPQYSAPTGAPIGVVRSSGTVVLLSLVTFGIYFLYWMYSRHEELKSFTGEGFGGGVAVLIALFVSPVLGFTLPGEVQRAYERVGLQSPVETMTGLWFFPGAIIFVGPFVWLYKVNEAINNLWISQGAQA